MTVKDSQKSILDYIYTLLTSDATLKAAMGGTVRLFHTVATPDAEFPYLVNRLDIRSTGFFPNQISTYYLDIWSDNPDSNAEVLPIRKRILELIDELQFDTTECVNGKIWKDNADGFIPEPEPNIWHYAMQFNLRFYRKSETSVIISR